MVSKFGKLDHSMTMICNLSWLEIQDNLFERQIAFDLPDLVARIFELKLQSLLDDITIKSCFGNFFEVLLYEMACK